MSVPPCYDECRAILAGKCAATGIEFHVQLAPRIIVWPEGFPPFVCLCPHGVRWMAEPTGEQRARWVTERTP